MMHIFKKILCVLSLLSIVFLVPSDAYANDGSIILETASLEHSGTIGRYNSLVQVDSDTYALAHSGTGGKGYISTFTISSDGTSIVQVNTLKHDDNRGQFNSLVHVDSNTYALAYTGDNFFGYISTFTIDSAGAITPILIQDHTNHASASANLEHDDNQGKFNSLVQVDSNTYALAYSGNESNGYISTFTILSDGSSIVEVETLEHDGSNGGHNSLLQIDSDTYALAYSGHRADGYVTTFTISSDGSSITEVAGSILEHDENKGEFNSLVHVGGDTYALAYSGNESDGYISTFTIDSNGAITPILIQYHAVKGGSANLEHDEIQGIHHSLVQVDSDTYALAYTGTNANGFISTFTISSDGSSIVKVKTLEHDTDVGNYNSLVHVGSDIYALAYTSGQKDGWITTFKIYQKVSSSTILYAPHIHDEVTVSINSNEKFNLNFKDKEFAKITSRVGDTVDIAISVGDDKKLDQISQVKFMTNFAKKPSGINNYFANNYNDYRQVALSVYEWNQHRYDVKYDYGGTVSWNEPSTMMQEYTGPNHDYVGPLLFNEEELIIVFSLNMTNVMDETQTITKIMDTSHMQKRSVLPFTLEVLPELAETTSAESVEEIESPSDGKSEFFIKSNKSTFEHGNKVVIKGQIPIQDFDPKQGQNIEFSITSPKNEVILSGQFAPKLDGSFIFETFATDSTWETDGVHSFNFKFGSISSNLVLSYDNSQFENVDLETRTDEKVVESVVAPSVVEEHKSIQLGIAAFVDQSKDPQHYIDRYFNESKYKQWFDKNYPQYISIYEAVGLEQPVKEKIVEIKTGKYISRR
ncbi:hypothetical protein OAJ86_04300 [Nitrosopumilus sp.]|nr:hypothetical protein [Nitrosopumilus sp.]